MDNQADIAVLKTKVEAIEATSLRIETKLDTQIQLFVTKGEFDEFKKRWALSHTIVAIITAIITALVVYFITGKHLGA